MTLTAAEILKTFQNKRVLVTGHTGFKGSWLSYWLTELGATVCGYSAYVPTEPAFFDILNLKDRVCDNAEDISDYNTLLKVIKQFKPEIVFHLAAQSITRQGLRNPRFTFETNTLGTVNVLEAIREIGNIQAVVCVTSDKCYENKSWEYGYRENDILGGGDPYSASKAGAELAIHAYYHSFFKQQGISIASGRSGNVVGGGDWAIDRIVPDCIRAWSVGEVAHIRHPRATRPWQFMLDPLYGYLSLGAHLFHKVEGINGESFNFGPHQVKNHSVENLVHGLSHYWVGSEWKIEENNNVYEPHLLKLSADKAWKKLKWETQVTFEEMLKLTAEWYLAYYYEKDVVSLAQEQIKFFEKRICTQEFSNSK